jgi:hypothetical protein
MIRQPLPSAGSLGRLSPLHRYYGLLRLPTARPASLRSPFTPRYLVALLLRSRTGEALPVRAWSLVTRCPVRGSSRRRSDLPGSWRALACVCHGLGLRPGLDTSPLRYLGAAPARRMTKAPTTKDDFGAELHGFRTRCLRFAARVTPAPRKTRFRLVASLYRAGFVSRWALLSVSVIAYMTSSRPRLCLAQSAGSCASTTGKRPERGSGGQDRSSAANASVHAAASTAGRRFETRRSTFRTLRHQQCGPAREVPTHGCTPRHSALRVDIPHHATAAASPS